MSDGPASAPSSLGQPTTAIVVFGHLRSDTLSSSGLCHHAVHLVSWVSSSDQRGPDSLPPRLLTGPMLDRSSALPWAAPWPIRAPTIRPCLLAAPSSTDIPTCSRT